MSYFTVNPKCVECGFGLSPTEAHYYTDRCERCERAWNDRIEAWRKGGEDQELDRLHRSYPMLKRH